MKLLMVTAVKEYRKEVLKLFKQAGIERFSGSEIDGYKTGGSIMMTNSWFPSEAGGAESILYFSFTQNDKVDKLFQLILAFNSSLETNNPIRAVVLPIEKHI